jgi:hypothetical protein
MSVITDIADAFGLRQTPWVVRTYIALLLVCAVLMLFALINGGAQPRDGHKQLMSLAIDSFKIVLGACIGSLSMAANQQWGGRSSRRGATGSTTNGE